MSLVFRRYSQIKKAPHVCDMRGLSLKGVEGQEGPTSVQEYNLPKGNRQRMPRIIPTGASDPCGMNLRSLWINSVNIGVPYFTWFYLNANKHFTWRWTMCQHQFWGRSTNKLSAVLCKNWTNLHGSSCPAFITKDWSSPLILSQRHSGAILVVPGVA